MSSVTCSPWATSQSWAFPEMGGTPVHLKTRRSLELSSASSKGPSQGLPTPLRYPAAAEEKGGYKASQGKEGLRPSATCSLGPAVARRAARFCLGTCAYKPRHRHGGHSGERASEGMNQHPCRHLSVLPWGSHSGKPCGRGWTRMQRCQ